MLGYFLRRMVPITIISPMLLQLILNEFQREKIIDSFFNDTLEQVGIFVILGIAVAIISRIANREEIKLSEIESKLHENEIIFNEFANHVDIVFYRVSPDLSKTLYISPAFKDIWGISLETLYEHPDIWFKCIIPQDQQNAYDIFYNGMVNLGHASASAEFRIRRPDNSIRNIFSQAFQLKDHNNNVFCITGVAIDITKSTLEKKYLQTQKDILSIIENGQTINQVAPNILRILCESFNWNIGEIWVLDEVNNQPRCIFTWHEKVNLLKNNKDELSSSHVKVDEGFLQQVLKAKKPILTHTYVASHSFNHSALNEQNCAFAVPIIFQDKVYGILNFIHSQIDEPDNQLLILMNNISKLLGEFIYRLHTNELVELISSHDTLSGLLNHKGFVDELKNLIVTTKPKNIVVIVFDIDRFKLTEEALGSDASDLILQFISKRIETLVSLNKVKAARAGNDKFIISFHNINKPDEIINFAQKIQEIFILPFKIYNKEYFFTISLGISVYPQDGANASHLISNANLAMMHAKKHGGNKVEFFNKELSGIAAEKLAMHIEIRQAIINNEFFINYQPQIDLKTGNICGAEALVRWTHPAKGLISPADFIPYAEQTGLITILNEHILRMVFQQIKSDWVGPVISINISAQQLNDEHHLVDYMKSLLNEFTVDPRFIELEITENMLIENVEHSLNVLTELVSLGLKLAIDDFGTGFSSFNYLHRLPAHKIKIDLSFIREIQANQVNATIVKAMIIMLHSLGKTVVAEGAQTASEINFLKQANCDAVQGFYYYRPMSSEDFFALIANVK